MAFQNQHTGFGLLESELDWFRYATAGDCDCAVGFVELHALTAARTVSLQNHSDAHGIEADSNPALVVRHTPVGHAIAREGFDFVDTFPGLPGSKSSLGLEHPVIEIRGHHADPE